MLRFNGNNGSFILQTNETEAAEAAGLTLSTTVRGPAGEKVYYTADHNQRPVFNPYAALEFHKQADDVALSKLAPFIQDYESSWRQETSFVAPAPGEKEPMPFQNAGVEYCLNYTNSIIGDEMGLGKTIQAILLANALDARRVLVLCPASIRLNWRREIHEWSTLMRPRVYPILKGSDGVNDTANYVICSYDLARNQGIHAALCAIEWDLIVCDEGHYLKTSEAQRTRAVFGGGERRDFFFRNGLDRRAKRIVSLTGTPLPNRPREAYTLARGLNWESIDYLSKDAFLYRYNPSIKYATGYTEEDKGRLPELNARLRCNLMVRRLFDDVMPQLPSVSYEMTYIETDGAIKGVLAKEALIDFDPQDLFNADFSLDGTPVSTLRREMGEAMVPRVVEYVKYMLDIVEAPKIVLFAHHRSVMAALAEALEEYGVCLHQGGMSTQAKDQSKIDFVEGANRIFLGQLDTMTGLDGLQYVSRVAIFAEPAWTPGGNEQCVKRLRRIGSDLGNILAHFLLVEGSFNEKVLNVVLGKAVDIHETLDRKLV
jgi:SWI/SNF-related matrix-associated actin-dependent regulator 1 of chromatin subfamily A